MFPTNSCPLTSSVQQLKQNCKGRLVFTSLFLQSPDALSDLTDAEKQFLLFICTFCSSNVIVTYFISFSDLSLPFIAPVCDFNRDQLFKALIPNIHPAATFLSTHGLLPGSFPTRTTRVSQNRARAAGRCQCQRAASPRERVGDAGMRRQLRGTDRHHPALRRELAACSAAALQSVVWCYQLCLGPLGVPAPPGRELSDLF